MAAARERALTALLRAGFLVPMPDLIYCDPLPERGTHPYSIWRFVEGTLLRDLLTTLPPKELVDVAYACGRTLAPLGTLRFQSFGEFGPDLRIVHQYGEPSRFLATEVQRCLFEGLAGRRLGTQLRDELWTVVEGTSPALSEIDGHYALAHCDYKRSNLIMTRTATTWSVAAVLDWEFACAGPPLIDFGPFLRAGSRLPPGFQDAFARGYVDAGGELPSEWLRLSRLLDLLSQMTFLGDPRDRPHVIEETIGVVRETIRILG